MFQKIFLGVSIVLVLAMAPSAFAGKIELTTYYPAPFGEYKNINTTENTNLATTTGSVTVGTTAATLPDPSNDNTLILRPVSGNAAAQTGSVEGSLRYSRDARGTNSGGLLYRNASSWAALGGTAIGSCPAGQAVTAINADGTVTCTAVLLAGTTSPGYWYPTDSYGNSTCISICATRGRTPGASRTGKSGESFSQPMACYDNGGTTSPYSSGKGCTVWLITYCFCT